MPAATSYPDGVAQVHFGARRERRTCPHGESAGGALDNNKGRGHAHAHAPPGSRSSKARIREEACPDARAL
eukprot:6916008-Alexandrium_andersonii.AAC.1